MTKKSQKEKAIQLRREGNTYSEILKVVPVAKSTLSLWFREVGLAKRQEQRISAKRYAAQKRGAAARRSARELREQEIHLQAAKDIGTLSRRERWLIGTSLYWAEGAKPKPWSPSVAFDFANSDAQMVCFMLKWLKEFCGVQDGDIILRLAVHENHRHRLSEIKRHWDAQLGLQGRSFDYVHFKKHNPKTKRKNLETETYFGLISLRVKRSTDLNRKIEGWWRSIPDCYCRVV